MDYNGWLGIKKRGGLRRFIKKTLKMIIIVEETNYTQMIKQFFEVFRLSKKILQSLNDFFYPNRNP